MKREIKFRAWDKKEKKMHQLTGISCSPTIAAWVKNTEGYDKILISGENSEIMQYTGLKDKNGKEIYEGDIVERKVVFINRSIVKFGVEDIDDNEGYSFNTVSGFYLNLIYQYGNYANDFSHMDKLSDSEVIGNIYENPELVTLSSQVKTEEPCCE